MVLTRCLRERGWSRFVARKDFGIAKVHVSENRDGFAVREMCFDVGNVVSD